MSEIDTRVYYAIRDDEGRYLRDYGHECWDTALSRADLWWCPWKDIAAYAKQHDGKLVKVTMTVEDLPDGT